MFMTSLFFTLKMTTARIFEKSVAVKNSPIQDYVHLDDHTQPTYGMKLLLGSNLL